MINQLAALPLPTEVGNITFPTPNPIFNNLNSAAGGILTWLIGFAGAFAVLAVIYSGFMVLTSGGNSDQAEKAKKNLTWAITGIVLVALSSMIVWWVSDILASAPH